MTKEEMIEVMEIYIAPLYQILGALCALAMVLTAYYFVIRPIMRKRVKR